MTRIAVVGGGAWGTALADLLARKGEQVTLWAREPEVVESINQRHVNDMFLPGAPLAPTLGAARDIRAVVRDADVIVSAAPSHAVRPVMTQVAGSLKGKPLVVSASKGLDPEKLERPSAVLGEVPAGGGAGRQTDDFCGIGRSRRSDSHGDGCAVPQPRVGGGAGAGAVGRAGPGAHTGGRRRGQHRSHRRRSGRAPRRRAADLT